MCSLFIFFINFDMMNNINYSKATLYQKHHWDLIVFLYKSLIFCKFIRNYIDSIKLTFAATCTSDEHEILVEDTDKKHRQFLTYRDFKTAKEKMIQFIKQIICWYCDDKEILILKEVVINANNNLLILHFRNVKCKRKNACTFCQNDLNFLRECVINSYFDSSMSLDTCSNCSWDGHSDRCSFHKFPLLSFQVIKCDTYKKTSIKKNKMTMMTAKWISIITIMNQMKKMMSNL